MPVHIKLTVSAIVLIVGAFFYYFERTLGDPQVAIVGAALAVFMVVSMWIFPETGNKRR